MNNSLKAAWKLSRPMNLFIVALLFYIIRYPVTGLFLDTTLYLSDLAFFTICFSSILIMAGGYVINDYFDRDIDAINKPSKQFIGKEISTTEAIQLHMMLSLSGILFGGSVAIVYEIYSLLFIQLFTVFALFYYASVLKKTGLPGNLLIALLTAIVPMVAGMYEYLNPYMSIPMDIVFAFAGFAFLFTLIRELVKDMEDMEGDRKFNCRTLPIRWGIRKTSILISVLLLMVIVGISYAQNFAYQLGDQITIYYFLGLVQLPCLFLIVKINLSKSKKQFHFISNFIKAIMLFGILYGILLTYIH